MSNAIPEPYYDSTYAVGLFHPGGTKHNVLEELAKAHALNGFGKKILELLNEGKKVDLRDLSVE